MTREKSYVVEMISTHSLTRRLTSNKELKNIMISYFNSQPHKEADALSVLVRIQAIYFNSQPHKEADHFCSIRRSLYVYFNSQPHKEADLHPSKSSLSVQLFQLTASQGG